MMMMTTTTMNCVRMSELNFELNSVTVAYGRLSARLLHLQCASNGDALINEAIEFFQIRMKSADPMLKDDRILYQF